MLTVVLLAVTRRQPADARLLLAVTRVLLAVTRVLLAVTRLLLVVTRVPLAIPLGLFDVNVVPRISRSACGHIRMVG